MRTVSALVAAVALAGATTASAGLLVNESFDDGAEIMWKSWTTDNSDIPGWRASVNLTANQYASWSVSTGSRTNKVGPNHLEITAGTFQTSADVRPEAIPGATYTLSFLTRMDGDVFESTMVYIDFFNDDTYTPLASQSLALPNRNTPFQAGGELRSYTFSAVAPEDATSVGVRVVQRAASYNWAESFDDFVLTVPEPASLSLLGLAGLLLGRRRTA